MYKLKPNVPDFAVVDGKFAGRKYRAGETYQEIPPEEKEKFAKSTEHGARSTEQSAKSNAKPHAPSAEPDVAPSSMPEGGKK